MECRTMILLSIGNQAICQSTNKHKMWLNTISPFDLREVVMDDEHVYE